MERFLIGAAVLHILFMISELCPWSLPAALRIASKKLPTGESFTNAQEKLVAAIVHNAGIYNGIVAGGLLWAALTGNSASDLARAMLVGAAIAGGFGTITLKSVVPAVQAVVGVAGLIVMHVAK
jgi:putative membrane protein